MTDWYVVHCNPCKEGIADQGLRRQGYWTFYPTERVRRRRFIARLRPVIEWVQLPYFPRYLFVGFRRAADNMRDVNETRGVEGIVRNGAEPVAVPSDVMTELMERVDPEGCMRQIDKVTRQRFEQNQSVLFVPGSPLAGLAAAVSVDTGKQVRLWVDGLGKMSVDPSLLEPAEEHSPSSDPKRLQPTDIPKRCAHSLG